MINKFILILVVIGIGWAPATFAETISDKMAGRILLQTESYGRAWYVDPVSRSRFYLQDGNTAYTLMRNLGLGITNSNLAKISTNPTTSPTALALKMRGRILLQVESKGEAWYVHPTTAHRTYLPDGNSAYSLMRSQALGITNANLSKISMNNKQLAQDTTFNDVAYVHLKNGQRVSGQFENQILSPASMTKLMTALTLLDSPNFDWTKQIIITDSHLKYPQTLVGNATTSEIKLNAGDIYSQADLWIAMLVASSNQATIALVDATGLTREQFVERMNNKAKELNLTKTVFYDPTGLNAHNLTTPTEMALIANAAFSRTAIADSTALRDYTLTNQKTNSTMTVVDRNFSLQSIKIDAAKTGYLVEAQRCVALKKGDDIVVVMHARSMTERNAVVTKLLK